MFFPVAVKKFVVLSIFTFGVYQFYWFYKNWRLVRERERTDISPFWRTFFAYFFCYALFKRVRDQQHLAPNSKPFSAGALAIGWIVLNLLWDIPVPWVLVCLGAVFFTVPVQAAAIQINAAVAPHHDRNETLSAVNWLGIVLGALLVILVLVAAMVLPESLTATGSIEI